MQKAFAHMRMIHVIIMRRAIDEVTRVFVFRQSSAVCVLFPKYRRPLTRAEDIYIRAKDEKLH